MFYENIIFYVIEKNNNNNFLIIKRVFHEKQNFFIENTYQTKPNIFYLIIL